MTQIINLSFAYTDEFSLFHQLDLNLARARHGLVGPNAAGKSTLLALIAGQLAPTAGSILYETRDLQYVSQLDALTCAKTTDLSVILAGRRIQTEAASAEDWTFMLHMMVHSRIRMPLGRVLISIPHAITAIEKLAFHDLARSLDPEQVRCWPPP